MGKRSFGIIGSGIAATVTVLLLCNGAWAQQGATPPVPTAQLSPGNLDKSGEEVVPPVRPAPPANETTEQKIARLERENADLRREVARLRSESRSYRLIIPPDATSPGAIPPGATPYPFNGHTFYYLPVQSTGKNGQTATQSKP